VRSSKVLGSGSEGRDGLVVEGCEVVLEGKEGYFLRMDFICCGVEVDVAIVSVGLRSEGLQGCFSVSWWRFLEEAIGVVLPLGLKRQRAFSR